MSDSAQAGARLLAERVAAAPALLHEAAVAELPPIAWTAVRRIRVTGLGSSAAHARALAHWLAEAIGLRAGFVATSTLAAGPPRDSEDDLLLVFSQGLSPNARFALAHPQAWRQLVLVTGAREDDAGVRDAEAKAPLLALLREAGASLVRLPGGDEAGTLLRVGGPLAGYAIALRLAQSAARACGRSDAEHALAFDSARVVPALASARSRAHAAWDAAAGVAPDAPLVLLTSGAYAELAGNLASKVLEGWIVPAPPIVDVLELAHGPLQQQHPHAAVFVALSRPGDAEGAQESAALALLERDLDAGRHRLVRLDATLPGPLALFEHETMMNEIILRGIASRGIDPARWPLRAPEPALYRHTPVNLERPQEAPPARRQPAAIRRLDALTWPEAEALIAGGCRTAVIALGATEQHGPHLALATDAWIAEALAERFCQRVPEALLAAVLPIGCSPEHLAFPGTLSLAEDTLASLLGDLAGSLARHGFDELFVFSAHGGNAAPLRALLPGLRAAHPRLPILADTDLARLATLQHAASARQGVAGAAAGHHAGEFETSIVLALRPEGVRRARLAPGLLAPAGDAQHVFHPSLREHAPTGVVGDPRSSSAARAEAYLAAWTDALVDAYRRAKNESQTNGTKSA